MNVNINFDYYESMLRMGQDEMEVKLTWKWTVLLSK